MKKTKTNQQKKELHDKMVKMGSQIIQDEYLKRYGHLPMNPYRKDSPPQKPEESGE